MIKKTEKADKIDIDVVQNPKAGPKGWTNRILIFTPVTGSVRVEWVAARYGQIIPTNWSHVEMKSWISAYMPLQYQLADAQNMMAREVVEKDYEWVLFIESDNILPADGFLRMNEYINRADTPIVSGIYWTKTNPPEPILYRGRGNSYYGDWKMGDKVWVDGVPFGFTLCHASLIKEAWKTSPEYRIGNQVTRRVFERAEAYWFDEKFGLSMSKQGTTDLVWCTRIMEEKLFEKAGWPEFQKKQYPFLVDTNMYVKHIDPSGRVYPIQTPKELGF